MAAEIIKYAAVYAVSHQFTKASLLLNLTKIMTFLAKNKDKEKNRHKKSNEHLSYMEAIALFYRDTNFFMKLETLYQHIEEKSQVKENKSVELAYQYLDETISQILRELNLLETCLEEYEKEKKEWEKWWIKIWWEPPYQTRLKALKKLLKELEERFSWYERINSVKVLPICPP